jgi:hypothetical protein
VRRIRQVFYSDTVLCLYFPCVTLNVKKKSTSRYNQQILIKKNNEIAAFLRKIHRTKT